MLVVLIVAVVLLAGQEANAGPAPLTLKDAIALSQRASPAHIGAAAVATGTAAAATAAGRRLNSLLDVRTENWTPSSANSLPLDIWATVSAIRTGRQAGPQPRGVSRHAGDGP